MPHPVPVGSASVLLAGSSPRDLGSTWRLRLWRSARPARGPRPAERRLGRGLVELLSDVAHLALGLLHLALGGGVLLGCLLLDAGAFELLLELAHLGDV